MARVKFKLNSRGVEKLLRSPGVERAVSERVAEALDWTGRDHYDGGTEDGGDRVRGYVVTSDFDGILDNHREHTLVTALGVIDRG